LKYCDSCHSAYPDDFSTCPRDQTPLRFASELPAGMVLRGKYEILEKVGAGGMAVVYRAKHRAFDEVVAIKVLSARLSDEDEFRRRFHTEAVVARRLRHPSAVRVEDLDTTEDGRPFIVMEYVEGRNLREVIRTEGALPMARAVEIARQVASALADAHALGIVHRDIKPDNILLTRDAGGAERARVLDFGISKVKEGALGNAVGHVPTTTGFVVGTPQYLSPEQAMGRRGDEIDGRADVYSLGVVLYEMVTGRLPFESDTAMGVILQHLQTPPTPPHLVRPDLALPAPLSDLLLRALEKDRDRRFATADEMRAALEAVPRAATPVGAPHPPARAPIPLPPLPQTPRPAATVQADIGEMPTLARVPTPAGPPPLPSRAPAPTPAVPPRRSRRRWMWAGIGVFAFIVFVSRDDERGRRRAPEPERPETAAEAAQREGEEQDARIEEEVEALLAATPSVREEDIEVSVTQGRVTLGGESGNETAIEVAKALAGTVAGVREVKSEVRLEKGRRTGPPRVEDLLPRIPLPPRPPGDAGVTPQATEAARKLVAEGRAHLAQGRARAAVDSFKAALDLDPYSGDAHEGLGRAIAALVQQSLPRFGGASPKPNPSP
jgi:serine/threonine protein kinase